MKLSNEISVKGGEVVFNKTNNRISIQHLPEFSLELSTLVQVLNHASAKVISNQPNCFVLQFDGIILNVYSVANIYTIHEIFIEKIYEIFMPQKKAILIDIGMNVGCASLFFSRLPFIEFIHGYEPFQGTFSEALANLALNPDLSSKIKAHNYGVSNYSGQTEVASFESGSAVANIRMQAPINETQSKTTLQIIGIIDILNRFFEEYDDIDMAVKIDCEGEEYVIMDALSESGYLRRITCLIIEWHLKGPQDILRILNADNFSTIHLPKSNNESGMIYAFK